jgi:hypothetical protein
MLHSGAHTMTAHTLSPPSGSVIDVRAFLRAAVRTTLGLAAIAAVMLTVLSVRYAAFEYTHGVQPIVRHLTASVSPEEARP